MTAPKIPARRSPFFDRIRYFILSKVLMGISRLYYRFCKNRDKSLDDEMAIIAMPFNTIVKWTERTREEEALSMEYARSIGLPVPRVLFYANDLLLGKGGAIWMTRIPGQPLSQVWYNLSDSQRQTIMGELHQCILRMRECKNPRSPEISSICRTDIRSFRAPDAIPPCIDKAELIRWLSSFRDPRLRTLSGKSAEYDGYTTKIEHLAELPHDIVFAHGDLYRHNILVKDGHLTGIIDWECAGWLPVYWDYSTMVMYGFSRPTEWEFGLYNNPAFKYYEEVLCDLTLIECTQASFPRW